MPIATEPPEVFDRARRRALRERASARDNSSFMWQYIALELADRLVDVSRTFNDVLIIGPMANFESHILGPRNSVVSLATEIDEDRLPYPAETFDLVIAAGTLDSVNDLPGALIQIRRCLRPDGLFLGQMFGAGTLGLLKTIFLDAQETAASPHIHPQIDLRTAADLLSRTGFALPVADSDIMTVRYSDWRRLVGDVRDMGVGNSLSGPRRYLGRGFNDKLTASWMRHAGPDGKVEEKFVHIHLSGWAPSADQPKPAKRGSASMSLASILPPSPPSA